MVGAKSTHIDITGPPLGYQKSLFTAFITETVRLIEKARIITSKMM